jgi:hypothetical protein
MSFESWEEHREQRLESLAADAISCLPEHDEPLANGLVVQT